MAPHFLLNFIFRGARAENWTRGRLSVAWRATSELRRHTGKRFSTPDYFHQTSSPGPIGGNPDFFWEIFELGSPVYETPGSRA